MVASCISCALVVLTASAQVSEGIVSAEGLSLLQTQVHKHDAATDGGESTVNFLSEHSDKECKGATKAHKDAKKQLKTDRAAVKEARLAQKAAIQKMKESRQLEADTLGKMEEMCPAPEIDRLTPDVGCSTTLVTSYESNPSTPTAKLLERGFGGYPTWYGFKDVVAGGGVPQGKGTEMGSKLGVAVVQPCSVAWTVGRYMGGRIPGGWGAVDWKTGKNQRTGAQVWMEKNGLVTAQACREWASTAMKWPKAALLEFEGLTANQGAGTICRVWAMPEEPWTKTHFGLQLNRGQNRIVSCWLGNPEEYKERLANERASGHVIDKCSKTSLWSQGQPERNVGPNGWSLLYRAGQLKHPDPPGHTKEGRKLCYKWVKADPKCANATVIYLAGSTGGCDCYDSVDTVRQMWGYEPTHPVITTARDHQVCQL